MPRYAIARFPAPVLNTPEFSSCFKGDTLPLDDQKLLRPVEIVLFPHSKIELVENIGSSFIWRMRTKEHPVVDPLYIDERFIAFVEEYCPERERSLPSLQVIAKRLREQIGNRYIWGGNWPQGVPQLLEWYTPSVKEDALDALIRDTWQLKGVDCSGLLYYATNGISPRNTAQLIEWGRPVSIENKNCDAILTSLQPLDIVVWQGHVVIALDAHTAIESKAGAGVVTSSLERKLQEIVQSRRPVDAYTSSEPSFVVRRWHPALGL